MSSTERGEGKRITWLNDTGVDVAGNDVVVLADMIGIALADIPKGAMGTLDIAGEHERTAKTTDTWDPGALLFWDAGNTRLTDTAGAVVAGHSTKTKTDGQTTACVLLNRMGLTVPSDGSCIEGKLGVDVYPVNIPLTAFRKSAAAKDDLPDAADATELGLADTQGALIVGTTTNNTTASEKAAVRAALPDNYAPGQAVSLRVRAKVSVARQVSATIDAVVKKCGDTLGSEICATAAQNLTTSFANYDFTITPTGLVAGDELNIELCLATNDTGGSSNGLPSISHVELRPTVRV